MNTSYNDLKLLGRLIEVQHPEQVPNEPHFVILKFEEGSVYHEGDERSRTNPGHGYPAYTEHYTKIRMYVTKEKSIWEYTVGQLYEADTKRQDLVAYEVKARAQVSTSVVVKFS